MSCLTQSDGLALLTLKLWSVVQGHKWSLKFICESIQGLLNRITLDGLLRGRITIMLKIKKF